MIEKAELVQIKGGESITAALLNAIVRIINGALELGRTVGTAIRRKTSKLTC